MPVYSSTIHDKPHWYWGFGGNQHGGRLALGAAETLRSEWARNAPFVGVAPHVGHMWAPDISCVT
eukprot:scaffold1350_cov56-Cyclotella_meneghiniana.AAC.1